MRALCAALLLAARTFGPQALPEVQDAEDPLVDALPIVPGLVVRLAYAGPRNVAGRALYPPDMPCLLRRSVAERLALAARSLRAQGFRIVAYDCWRGPRAQRPCGRPTPILDRSPTRGAGACTSGASPSTWRSRTSKASP